MIDNFEIIKPLLHFPNDQTFYFVQVLQRKKDHPEGTRLGGSNNNSRVIKAYYMSSVDKLDIHKEEIIKLCEVFNARACINLNPRNRKKAAHAMLIKLANQLQNEDYRGCAKVYDSVCGEYHSEMDRRWIVDIDKEDIPMMSDIQSFIQSLHDEINNKDYNILSIIPSKSGFHIITNPFNVEKFSKVYPNISLHKNNPTSLFIV